MTQPPPGPPPAPPPPPGPPSGPSGTPGAFSVGETISYAWNTYWKNVGPMLLIVIVIAVINAIFSGVGQASGEPVVVAIFSLIGWLVGLFLALGLIRAALAVTRGERPEVSMLFHSAGFGPYILASIVFGIGFVIGLALCIIPGIIFAIAFGFYGYLIVDEGVDSPIDSLKRSAEITRGHRGTLFVLGLALLGINIVGLLVCFVGVLFTGGITAIAVAHAYRTLKGQAITPAA